MDQFTSARTGDHVARALTRAFGSNQSMTIRIVIGGTEQTTSFLVTAREELLEGIKFTILDLGTNKYYTTTVVKSQLNHPVTFIEVPA